MKRKAVLLLANAIVMGCSLFYAVSTYYLHRNHRKSNELAIDWGLEKIERIPIQSKKNITSIALPPPPSQLEVGDTPNKLQKPKHKKNYWRYDEAGPKITRATTHYLSSIPKKNRLGLPPLKKDIITEQQIQNFYNDTIQNRYASNPDNVYPSKLHLYEMNPSITKLPDRYRENEDWRRVFGTETLPYYVASYRVTHLHNCFDDDTRVKLMGDNWKHISRLTTDYLGISLMDEDLNILVDTTVDMNKTNVFHDYGDYRLFNLGEQLYLTTWMEIAPIDLSLIVNNNLLSSTVRRLDKGLGPEIPFLFREIPTAFPSEDAKSTSLRIWLRKFPSCAVNSAKYTPKKDKKKKNNDNQKPSKQAYTRARGKNFLYFGRNTTSTTDTTTVIRYLKYNPIDARTVDLTTPCVKKRIKEGPTYDEIMGPVQPKLAFETLDAFKYSRKSSSQLFNEDRGSACCTSVKAKSLFPISLQDTSQNTTIGERDLGINEDDEILVAIVHPKTKFPGKGLPKGITPNTYLSRFVAFLPKEPYTIVAKSGMFCLGYPSRKLDGTTTKSENPLEFVQMNRLSFATKFYECPRIHFVTGMVDAPVNTANNKTESDSVIIAYGVSDCLSRFVEIPKSEIIRMLTPDG